MTTRLHRSISRLGAADHRLLHGVTGRRRRWLTAVLVPYTIAGTSGAPWVVAGLVTGNLLPVLGAVLAAAAVAETVKHFVGRPRPDVVPLLVRIHRTGSFPSGHAATSAAAAAALCLVAPELTLVWIGMACAMALSRVYVGVHWPSDVVAGVGLGLVVAAASFAVVAAV
jgi:membrane-associated phospholipid phosphatase